MISVGSLEILLPISNEEKRISTVLQHQITFGLPVTVIDNKSVDRSVHIVRTLFPSVRIVTLKNSGSAENPCWWREMVCYLSSEYVLFASCSEFIPNELFEFFLSFSLAGMADLLDVQRMSFTGQESTDYLYCRPSSLLSCSIKYPYVTRLLRWRMIDPSKISPHDSFRSQKSCSRLSLNSVDTNLMIHHFRPLPSWSTLDKHTQYAKVYAACRCRSNFMYAFFDSFSRFVLDSLRLFMAFLKGCLTRILLIEYMLRVFMHLQVIWFSVLPSSLGSYSDD